MLRQIRADAALRSLKVIVLTSSDQSHDRVLSRELGCDAYLVKPASIVDLMELLRSCPDLLAPPESATN